MRIYYAHHLWKYNTKIEEYELSIIRKKFPDAEILNPNGMVCQSLPESEIVQDCFSKILECDALVFSDISGMVGYGVYSEVQFASFHYIPIYRIVGTEITMPPVIKFEVLHDSKDLRVYAEIKN